METNHNQIVSLIWNIADDVLRDVFLRGQYRDVILPMVVLRRLDALLEPTKEEVEEELRQQKELGLDDVDEDALKDITGLSYFNTSKWTLNRLKSTASDNNDILYDNFIEYLNGYSENVRDVLKNFEYYTKARKLADNATSPMPGLTCRPQRLAAKSRSTSTSTSRLPCARWRRTSATSANSTARARASYSHFLITCKNYGKDIRTLIRATIYCECRGN